MKDLGPANKILGMQIHRDKSKRKIWLSQKNYMKKILQHFNMQDCKQISTPLPINFKLSSSMSPSNEVERMEMSRVPYASVVGSLMFFMICTRPDIAQAVGAASRYIANPGRGVQGLGFRGLGVQGLGFRGGSFVLFQREKLERGQRGKIQRGGAPTAISPASTVGSSQDLVMLCTELLATF